MKMKNCIFGELLSYMTEEEFIPVTKTFTKNFKKDNLDVAEMNLLLDQSRELAKKIIKQ